MGEPAPDLTYARLQQLIRAIATFTDQGIGPRNPILSAMLPDGERIQIVVPPAAPPETISLSIRLPSSETPPLEAYEAEGVFATYNWAVLADSPPRISICNPMTEICWTFFTPGD